MNAIDRVLRCGSNIESMHQMVFRILLEGSRFGELLDLCDGPVEVIWEPNGGTFDLRADSSRGSAWLELKVMSSAGKAQLDKQGTFLQRVRAEGNSRHEGVYITLGSSDYEYCDEYYTKSLKNPARRIGTQQVADALHALRDDPSRAIRELAENYERVLRAWLSWRERPLPANTSEWGTFEHYELYRRIQRALGETKTQIYKVQSAGAASYLLNVSNGQPIFGDVAQAYVEVDKGYCLLKVFVNAPEQRKAIRKIARERLKPRLVSIPGPVTRFGKMGQFMSLYRVEEDLRAAPDPTRAAAIVRESQNAIERLGAELCQAEVPQ